MSSDRKSKRRLTLKSVQQAGKGTTKYSYDDAWNMSCVEDGVGNVTNYGYDAAGNVIWTKDGEGHICKYNYDAFGRLLSETDANGNTTQYTYDANSNCTKTIDALGNATSYSYDKENRVVAVTDANNHITTFKYDEMGNMISVTDALGNTVQKEYDAYGNLISDFDAKGTRLFTNTYDDMGNLIKTVDALGYQTSNTYNNMNELIECVDAMNHTTKLTYDKAGNIASVQDPEDGVSKQTYSLGGKIKSYTNPIGGGYTYTYDSSGNLTKETTSMGYSHLYTYDEADKIKTAINGRGQSTVYTYDHANRMTSFSDQEGKVSYKYDAAGNLLQVLDADNSIQREYDALNRVVKYIEANGIAIKYQYDAVGNLIKTTYSNNKEVKYRYNAINLLTEVEDWAGRKTQYSYDVNGRLEKTVRPDGSFQVNTYDALGQLVSIVDKTQSGQLINKYTYTYDAKGNIISETSSYGNVSDSIPSSTITMTYDKDNRMTTYNGEQVIYDNDGNMTYGPLNGQWVEFEYDTKNRLVRAGDTTYEYDGENNRIAATTGDKCIRYVVDSNFDLPRTVAEIEDNEVTWYVYGKGLIGQEKGEQYLNYHFDSRGSTTAITDASGQVTDRFTYTAYGELVDHQGKQDISFLYNGKSGVMTDSDGLYYMYTRYYNPDIKRFMNADVVAGSILNSATLNRYAYVNGNPISYTDPFGMSAEETSDNQYLHDILDLVGWIPVIGDVCDVANAALYATEGKWSQVGTYVACAAGANLLFKGVKYGCKMLKSYGKNLIEDVAKKIGIKCLRESAEEIAEHTSINVVRSYADEVAEKSVKELAENNSEHAAREVAEDVARKSASEAAENASEKEVAKFCDNINCFTAGTLILTANGYKPIEDIKTGDYVYSENPETGEKGLKQVVQTFENEKDELVEVYIDGEIIETTTGHPFWVEDKGWTDAKDLQAGDQVRLKASKTATIDKVEIIVPKERVKVYNFEVEDWHTYYVSEMGVLVHNMCGGKGTSRTNKYWKDSVNFNGNKVYQRNDLFDPNTVSSWKVKGKTVTGTNIERMASGRAPIGYDGKPINLHHLSQTQTGAIAEVSQSLHQTYYSILHINTGQLPSGINRSIFNNWKEGYWIYRATGFAN